MVAAAYIAAGTQLAHDPALLALPLALMGSFSLVGTVVGKSAFEYRRAAAVDQLTGLLGRGALAARALELEHQSADTGQPVALLVADLDRFKAINDEHGHATGDAVLREVGERLRSGLRAFESVYRFGGEEFVVLLPGLGALEAAHVAERLAEEVRGAPVNGLPVTISIGVAATTAGEPCRFEQLFDRADRALYVAKRDGRDQVAAEPFAVAPAVNAA
jgi:diguanylate cyclase (GGDEF)-like protein